MTTLPTPTATEPVPVPHTVYFHRFTLGQRYLHGIVIITFLGLALTGLPLRFSNTAWALELARVMGGFGSILFFHKLSAVVLTIGFAAHVADIGYRAFVKKQWGLIWGPDSLVPSLKDIKDLFQHFRYFLWMGPKPRFERYAYWDKVDYWAVFWGMAIIGFSGYAMWFAPFFARFIPGSWLNIALLIHGEEALLAVSFIFTIHYFNTHLRPHNFPMDLTIFTGRQTEEEFKEKHPEEYARLKAEGKLDALKAPVPETWLKKFGWVVGTIAFLLGFAMLFLTVTAFIKEL
jgi:cytochrome b subunit of formate dehydrogenase